MDGVDVVAHRQVSPFLFEGYGTCLLHSRGHGPIHRHLQFIGPHSMMRCLCNLLTHLDILVNPASLPRLDLAPSGSFMWQWTFMDVSENDILTGQFVINHHI